MSIKYNIEITDNKEVTPIYYTNTIIVKGKIEGNIADFVIGDGYIDIRVSKIGTLKTVFAETEDATLTFQNALSETVSSIRVAGQLAWEMPSAVGSGIVNCRVQAHSTSPVDANIILIGV
jgi:hypothetical protein